MCYACGQPGYKSNDPICPKFGAAKATVRYMHDSSALVENLDDSSPAAPTEGTPEDLTKDVGEGGSQYSS